MKKIWMNLKSGLAQKSNSSPIDLLGFTPTIFIASLSALSLVAILTFARQGNICRFDIFLGNDGGRITIEGGKEPSEGCKSYDGFHEG